MFGRGTWAILGLAKESLEALKTSLEDRALMAAASQMAASAVTRQFGADTLGINPFNAPRLDEDHPLALEHQEEFAKYATTDPQARAGQELPAEVLNSEGYGYTMERFQLHATIPWIGLWAVSNEWKDVSDLASLKEHRSYLVMERPYRFLQTADKSQVDQDALGATAAVRKQAPVLLDFNEGRVYIESGNKKLIQSIMLKLQQLGAEVFPVAWTYSNSNWISTILNKLYEGTQYGGDFMKRAEETTRFASNEIEKLEDKELEGIVKNYFSMTSLPSDVWVGISGPAQVRLHDTSPPIGVKVPTSVTTLLHMTNDAKIISGSITFQERVSFTAKDGSDRTFRKDLISVQMNDRINLTEAGAAMLRGFDLPTMRKDILREIKQTKQVPSIQQFWGIWLHELNNAVRSMESAFREILEIDGNQEAGILPMKLAAVEDAAEMANA